jgi:hypothetical protein
MYKDIPKLETAIALDGYKLALTFNDGVSGVVDLSDLKGKGVFEYWNDENNFKKFEIVWNALTWNEDIDMDGDSFYLQIINKDFFEYARD